MHWSYCSLAQAMDMRELLLLAQFPIKFRGSHTSVCPIQTRLDYSSDFAVIKAIWKNCGHIVPAHCVQKQFWFRWLCWQCEMLLSWNVKRPPARLTSNLWAHSTSSWSHFVFMMMSSNENIFRVTGPLCGEFTGPWWIPSTKASDAELWCFLWSASG